jgi:hypothetical protein
LDDALIIQYRKEIADFAIQKRLPSVFAAKDRVEAGGLLWTPKRTCRERREQVDVTKMIVSDVSP